MIQVPVYGVTEVSSILANDPTISWAAKGLYMTLIAQCSNGPIDNDSDLIMTYEWSELVNSGWIESDMVGNEPGYTVIIYK